MEQMEDRLPVLLRRLADEVPPLVVVPPELLRRSRRLIVFNGVVAAAVVVGLTIGSVAAFRALIPEDVPDRPVPASEPTPAVGKIAFPSSDGGIYLVNKDGGGLVRLTQGEFPSFSPDGTNIAFTRNGQVHVMDADGTGISRVTDQARAPSGLAWSPDGTRIAFVGTRSGEPGLIIVNSDGGSVPRVVSGIPAGAIELPPTLPTSPAVRSTPSWSPDGAQILIDASYGFYLTDVESGEASLLAEHPPECRPWTAAFSPDGATIAFTRWRSSGEFPAIFCRLDGIFLMDTNGANVRRLTDRSLLPWGPAWSPDGTRIAFFSQPGGPTSALYVVNVDGSGLTKLADIGQGDLGRFLPASPSWSPVQ